MQKDVATYIAENLETIDWYVQSAVLMPESVIEKYADSVDWWQISKHQKLSEAFIVKFANQLNWNLISLSQDLTDDVLKKYTHKLDTAIISNVCCRRLGFLINSEHKYLSKKESNLLTRSIKQLMKKINSKYTIVGTLSKISKIVAVIGWLGYFAFKPSMSKIVNTIILLLLGVISIVVIITMFISKAQLEKW